LVPAPGLRAEIKPAPVVTAAIAAAQAEPARIVSAATDVPVGQPTIQVAETVPAQMTVQQGSFTDALKTASAPAPAAPAPAPSPAPLPTQLAKPLFTLAAAAPGEHIMTVKVAPEDLGPVTVRAHIGSDGVRLEIFAAGDAGRDAVRAALPELRRDLALQGMGASLDLSGRNAPSDHGSQQNQSGPGNPEGLFRPRLRMVEDAAMAPHGQPLRPLRSEAALDVVA
jgi:flagellar hook-length control protein FliK